MNQSIIIFICLFDPIGEDRCVYSFEPRCAENPELPLKDGTTRIFLNTKGKNRHELPAALVELLDYLENPHTTLLSDQRMIELDDRLQKVKRDKEARDQYMTLQNLIEEERDEARAEGYAGNIAIIRKKFDKGYAGAGYLIYRKYIQPVPKQSGIYRSGNCKNCIEKW